jgi:hypothetical protein
VLCLKTYGPASSPVCPLQESPGWSPCVARKSRSAFGIWPQRAGAVEAGRLCAGDEVTQRRAVTQRCGEAPARQDERPEVFPGLFQLPSCLLRFAAVAGLLLG